MDPVHDDPIARARALRQEAAELRLRLRRAAELARLQQEASATARYVARLLLQARTVV
jgi:hypothetical protein